MGPEYWTTPSAFLESHKLISSQIFCSVLIIFDETLEHGHLSVLCGHEKTFPRIKGLPPQFLVPYLYVPCKQIWLHIGSTTLEGPDSQFSVNRSPLHQYKVSEKKN